LLANAVWQANAGYQADAILPVLTPSRASAFLQWIYAVREAFGRHKSVGAGLLANAVWQANAVRQANAMSSVLTPSRASALLQFMAFAGHVIDTNP
jgi:hypothetical protein